MHGRWQNHGGMEAPEERPETGEPVPWDVGESEGCVFQKRGGLSNGQLPPGDCNLEEVTEVSLRSNMSEEH